MAMKLLGAGYLMHIGWKSLTRRCSLTVGVAEGPCPSALEAFGMGFMTNALNSKTMLFVAAAYSQVVQANRSLGLDMGYGVFMSISHWLWFSLVALFFSADGLRQRMLARQHVIDKVIGVALIGLGSTLLLSELG